MNKAQKRIFWVERWYKKNPDYLKKWRKKHRERLNKKNRLFLKNNPLKALEYYETSYKKNKLKIIKASRKWQKKNKEHVKNYQKTWINKNRDLKNYLNQQRRVSKFRNGGFHSLEDWQKLKINYNLTCPSCRKTEPKIKLCEDHIIPLSKGGTDNIENIQPLCKSCNSKKKNKTIKYVKIH